MKELNLELGQKVWSIQLGDCEVVNTEYNERYPIVLKGEKGVKQYYTDDLKLSYNDYFQSVFESNPFEKINNNKNRLTWRSPSLGENEIGFLYERNRNLEKVSEPENKYELINSLFEISKENTISYDFDIVKTAKDKLKKLLESL